MDGDPVRREITEGAANNNNWQRDSEANLNSWKILLPNNVRKPRSLKKWGSSFAPRIPEVKIIS